MAQPDRLYADAEGRPVVETRFRVRYYETDAMGIVHHAVYITWFEEGRSAFTRCIGLPYSQLAADGIDLAVVDVAAHYLQPARYDDEVSVAACLAECRSRQMTFTYEVRRAADAALLVTGSSRHVSVDRAGHATMLPAAVREAMMNAAKGGN
jgi:acyl-CoA thioester hydrolase